MEEKGAYRPQVTEWGEPVWPNYRAPREGHDRPSAILLGCTGEELDNITIALDAHKAAIEILVGRIESLERWRRSMYGTYKATDADYREWSGREPEEWADE